MTPRSFSVYFENWQKGAGFLVTGILLLATVGCASHARRPPAGGWPEVSIPAATFAYTPGPDPRLRPDDSPDAELGRHDHHDVYVVEMPSAGYNNQPGNQVTATYYISRSDSRVAGQKRLIVVLPIWGSSEYPSRTVVRRLVNRRHGPGTNVLWVDGPRKMVSLDALLALQSLPELNQELDRTIAATRNTVADVRRLIDWAVARGDVDPQRIGIAGFSISAMVGAMVMAVDERVQAGVFVMGGAHLNEALGSCPRRTAAARENVLAQLDWSVDDFKNHLGQRLDPVEPIHFLPAVRGRNILVLESMIDGCMNKKSRAAFWNGMGRPKRVLIPFKHQLSFFTFSRLFLRTSVGRIERFFNRHLPVPAHQMSQPISRSTN